MCLSVPCTSTSFNMYIYIYIRFIYMMYISIYTLHGMGTGPSQVGQSTLYVFPFFNSKDLVLLSALIALCSLRCEGMKERFEVGKQNKNEKETKKTSSSTKLKQWFLEERWEYCTSCGWLKPSTSWWLLYHYLQGQMMPFTKMVQDSSTGPSGSGMLWFLHHGNVQCYSHNRGKR